MRGCTEARRVSIAGSSATAAGCSRVTYVLPFELDLCYGALVSLELQQANLGDVGQGSLVGRIGIESLLVLEHRCTHTRTRPSSQSVSQSVSQGVELGSCARESNEPMLKNRCAAMGSRSHSIVPFWCST